VLLVFGTGMISVKLGPWGLVFVFVVAWRGVGFACAFAVYCWFGANSWCLPCACAQMVLDVGVARAYAFVVGVARAALCVIADAYCWCVMSWKLGPRGLVLALTLVCVICRRGQVRVGFSSFTADRCV
jgi:hypothetical protein